MSESGITSVGFNRSDLNLDISRMVDAQGSQGRKLNYAESLNKYFPARNLTPRDYAAKYSVSRKVKFVYAGPGSEIPVTCPRGWDLLVVCGVAFTKREREDVTELLNNAQTASGVILGIPLEPMPGVAQIKELMALDELAQHEPYDTNKVAMDMLQTRRASLLKQLRERLRKVFGPSSFSWLEGGKVLEEAPPGSRNSFFTSVLESRFSLSPAIKLHGSRRDWFESLREMSDLTGSLQILAGTGKGSAGILRHLLVDTQLFKLEDDNGSYLNYVVNPHVPENSSLYKVWDAICADIVGDGMQPSVKELSHICAHFRHQPFGLDNKIITILLAAVMRRYYPDVELLRDGEPIPPSAFIMKEAIASPRGWQVSYNPAAADEAAFLRSIYDLFGAEKQQAGCHAAGLWEATRDAMYGWMAALPAIVDSGCLKPEKEGRELLDLLKELENAGSAHDLFEERIPALLGLNGIPLEEEQSGIIDYLRTAKEQVDGILPARLGQLTTSLCRIFCSENPDASQCNLAWLEKVFSLWVDRLYPGSQDKEFSSIATQLLSLKDIEAEPEVKWFEILPVKLGLKPVRDWNPDCRESFINMVVRARLEAELWHVRELFPMPEEKLAAKEKVLNWMRPLLDGLELQGQERESVLIDVLDSQCWSY